MNSFKNNNELRFTPDNQVLTKVLHVISHDTRLASGFCPKTYLRIALPLCFILYCLAYFLPEMPPLAVWFSVILTACPIYFALNYRSVMIKTRNSIISKENSVYGKIVYRKRFLSFLISLLLSIILAFSLLIQLIFCEPVDFIILFTVPFIIAYSYNIVYNLVDHEVVAWFRNISILSWLLRGIIVYLFMITIIFSCIGLYDIQSAISLTEALETRPQIICQTSIISILCDFGSYIHTIRCYIGSVAISDYSILNIIIFIIIYGFGCYGFFMVMIAFIIPKNEYRRIFISECIFSNNIPLLTPANIATYSFWGFIIICSTGALFYISEISMNSYIKEYEYKIENTAYKIAVSIDGVLYHGDILNDRRSIDYYYNSRIQALQDKIINANHAIRETMISNVDTFLDWYYSIPGEYARIGSFLLSGDAESLLKEKLTEFLSHDVDSTASQEASAELKALQEEWKKAKEDLLANSPTLSEEDNTMQVTVISRDRFLETPVHHETINLEMRISGATGSAAVSSAVAGKVMLKASGKTAAKALASALIKLGTKSGLSVISSAVTGAAAGTCVGGPAGAVVGFCVGVGTGIVTWISVDGAILTLEELISREEFRREIIAEIDSVFGY